MIGPTLVASSPHSPFPNMNLESSKPLLAWPGRPTRLALQKAKLKSARADTFCYLKGGRRSGSVRFRFRMWSEALL